MAFGVALFQLNALFGILKGFFFESQLEICRGSIGKDDKIG